MDNMWNAGHDVVAGWTFNSYKLGDAVVMILSHPRFGPLSYYLEPAVVARFVANLQATLAASGSAPIPPADLPKAH